MPKEFTLPDREKAYHLGSLGEAFDRLRDSCPKISDQFRPQLRAATPEIDEAWGYVLMEELASVIIWNRIKETELRSFFSNLEEVLRRASKELINMISLELVDALYASRQSERYYGYLGEQAKVLWHRNGKS